MSINRNALSFAIFTAITLSACGGGSTATRPTPTPPPPATTPPVTTCQDRNATNFGGPLPCVFPSIRYTGREVNHLVPTNADLAHAAGITGQGTKIGILDSGADRSLGSLSSAVVWYKSYLPTDPNDPNHADLSKDDVRGHGTFVAEIAAGDESGPFPGGVAPGASLYIARVGTDNGSLFSSQVANATRDLLAQGVKIYNLSFGGSPFDASDPNNQSRAIADRMFLVSDEALAANALWVWGAGNTANLNASGQASLPVIFPDLAHNWLAVVGTEVDANGNPTQIAAESSICGAAAQWCVTAPFRVQALAANGGLYVPSQGTSFAAPQAAGVAALVSSAFPWMGGDLLQLSILTTATDLGAAGVDSTYGWGLLNAQKAIRGPGQFALGDVTANVDRTGSWTWSNDIGGNGGLTKTGVGRLLLSGANTYAGATQVSGGTLALSGSLRSNVSALAGGTIESQGGTITGTYTATNGSTTAIALGGPLTVNGSAILDGTLRVLPARVGYVVAGTESLMTASNGLSGTFDATTFDANVFYTGTLSYAAKALSINLTRTSATLVALSAGAPTQGAVANGSAQFDAVLGLADQWAITGTGNAAFLDDASLILNALSSEQAVAGLESLSGEVHGTARNALLASSGQVARTLGDRVDDLAHGRDAGGWLSLQAAHGDLSQSGYTSADTNGSHVLAGADGQIGAWTLGGMVGTGETRVALGGDAGRFDADRTMLGGYGRYAGDGWYASGALTREWLDVTVDRTITGNAVTGSRNDRVDQGRIEFGRTGDFSPYVAYRQANYRMGDFTETGSTLGLTADADTHVARWAEAGARYTRAFTWAAGDSSLTGTARWQHLLNARQTGFEAAFSGSPTITFNAQGQRLDRDTALLGLSLATAFGKGWAWFVDGEIEAGGGDVVGSRVSVGVRGSF